MFGAGAKRLPFRVELRIDAQCKQSVAVQKVPSSAHLAVKRQANGKVLLAISGSSQGQYMAVDACAAEFFLQVFNKSCVARL